MCPCVLETLDTIKYFLDTKKYFPDIINYFLGARECLLDAKVQETVSRMPRSFSLVLGSHVTFPGCQACFLKCQGEFFGRQVGGREGGGVGFSD